MFHRTRSTKKPTVSRRRKWSKRLLVVFLLFLIGYNILFSSWFICGVIFPLLGDVIGFQLDAQKVQISFLNRTFQVEKLYFGPGWRPILTLDFITGKFDLQELLKGRLNLSDLMVDGAKTAVVRNQSGFFNVYPAGYDYEAEAAAELLPPILNKQGIPIDAGAGDIPVFPLQIKGLTVKNSSFFFTYISDLGFRTVVVDVTNINGFIDKFGNNSTTKVDAEANCRVVAESINMQNSHIKASGLGTFTEKLLPASLQAVAVIEDLKGNAGLVNLADKRLRASGSAHGIDVLTALTVDYVDVEFYQNNVFSSKLHTAADMTFYPWNMDSEIGFRPLKPTIGGYLASWLDLPFEDWELEGEAKFKLNDLAADLSGNLAARGANDIELSSAFNTAWDIPNDSVAFSRLALQLSSNQRPVGSGQVANAMIMDYKNSGWSFRKPVPQLELKFDKINIPLLWKYIGLPDNIVESGEFSADLTGIPTPDLDGIAVSGWCNTDNVAFNIHPYKYENLDGNISLEADLTASGNLNLRKFDAVIAENGEQLLVLQLPDSFINLFSGKFQLDACFSAMNESLLRFPPFNQFSGQPWLRQILKTASPIEVTAKIPISYTPGETALTLNNSNLVLYSKQRTLLQLLLSGNRFNWQDCLLENNLAAELKLEPCPLSVADQIMAEYNWPLSFKSGTIQGSTELNISPDFKLMHMNGILQMQDTLPAYRQWRLPSAGVNLKWQAELSDWYNLQADILSAQLLFSDKLQFEANSDLAVNLQTGDWQGKVNADYVTGRLLREFDIPVPADMNAGGVAELNWRSLKDFTYSGELHANSFPDGTPISCRAILHATGTEQEIKLTDTALEFFADNLPIASATLTGYYPQPSLTAAGTAYLQLSAPRFDAKTVFSLFRHTANAPKEVADGTTPEPGSVAINNTVETEETSFYFGLVPINVDVLCDGISWGDNINANLRSRLQLCGNRLNIERMFLRFNGAEVRIAGNLLSTPTGINYGFQANSDDAELSTIMAPFLSADLGDFSAAMTHCKLNVSGESLAGNRFWDTQQGELKVDFAKVKLPHTLGNTVVGRVLLLPFSVLVNLQEFLPTSWEKLERALQVVALVKRFYNNTEYFEFDHGALDLTMNKGQVTINQGYLTGTPVNSLRFTGHFFIGSKQDLNMDSAVEMMRLTVPMGIRGTWREPQIQYGKLAVDVVKYNTKDFLDSVVDITTYLPEKALSE